MYLTFGPTLAGGEPFDDDEPFRLLFIDGFGPQRGSAPASTKISNQETSPIQNLSCKEDNLRHNQTGADSMQGGQWQP